MLLKVDAAMDIGSYLLAKTEFLKDKSESVNSRLQHVFWSPDRAVNAGDFVALYTKAGKSNRFDNKSGTVTHNFYWRLSEPIWDGERDGIVLFDSDWTIVNPSKGA